jgi:hypothetical protein
MATVEEQLSELATEQSKLLKALEADRKKGRDLWEKLGMLSGVVSALLVAFIGYLTIRENQVRARDEGARKQAEIDMLQMQTIEKFIPHLAATSEEEKKVTVLALSLLKNDKFVAQLTTLYPTSGVKQAGEIIMARGDTTMLATPPSTPQAGTGWAYLGTFNTATGRWETRYFDFQPDAPPVEGKRLNSPHRNRSYQYSYRLTKFRGTIAAGKIRVT